METHRQMQLLQVSNRKLEDADENAQWEKVKLMQPMRLYVSSDPSTFRTQKDTVEKSQTNATNVTLHLIGQVI